MKILVFGSCNIDYVYNVPHIVRPGETLTASGRFRFPGGKGLNQAIAVAKAGASVQMAGCVGEDDDILRPVLEQAGVDLTWLATVKEPTGHAMIQVEASGENSIVIYPGANGMVSEEQIDRTLTAFEAGDLLLLQNEIANLPYLIGRAAEKGMRIFLNPSPFEEALKEIGLHKLSGIILNETEAAQWSGLEEPEKFLDWIGREYPELEVVLTLGKQGSVYQRGSVCFRQQAYTVTAVDTTAAGDTFTGYFLDGLYRSLAIPQILDRASAASAIAVSRMGAAASIPTSAEVEQWMQQQAVSAK